MAGNSCARPTTSCSHRLKQSLTRRYSLSVTQNTNTVRAILRSHHPRVTILTRTIRQVMTTTTNRRVTPNRVNLSQRDRLVRLGLNRLSNGSTNLRLQRIRLRLRRMIKAKVLHNLADQRARGTFRAALAIPTESHALQRILNATYGLQPGGSSKLVMSSNRVALVLHTSSIEDKIPLHVFHPLLLHRLQQRT